jgi:hypothetical protein
MQPRTLDQIMAELGSVYDPQVNSIRQRQTLIPEQLKADEAGLEAKQVNAFDSILSGARGRGLGFSGIPLGEQAKYTASEFLPAIARARSQAKEQAMSLEDAILGIRERQQSSAMNQRQYEQTRWDNYQAELRAAAEQRAAASRAAAAAASPTWYVPPQQQQVQRPDLSSFFQQQNINVIPLRQGGTVTVAKPKAQPNLTVAKPKAQPKLTVAKPKSTGSLSVR